MKRLLPHLQPLVLLVFSLAHLPHLTNSQTTPNNINFPITHTTTTTFTVTRTEDFNFTTTTTTVSTITPSYCPTQSCVTSNALWTTTGGFSVAGAVVTPSAQGTNWIPVQTWAAAHQIGENQLSIGPDLQPYATFKCQFECGACESWFIAWDTNTTSWLCTYYNALITPSLLVPAPIALINGTAWDTVC